MPDDSFDEAVEAIRLAGKNLGIIGVLDLLRIIARLLVDIRHELITINEINKRQLREEERARRIRR